MIAQENVRDYSLAVVGRISNWGLCGNGKDSFYGRTITDSNVAAAYKLRNRAQKNLDRISLFNNQDSEQSSHYVRDISIGLR